MCGHVCECAWVLLCGGWRSRSGVHHSSSVNPELTISDRLAKHQVSDSPVSSSLALGMGCQLCMDSVLPWRMLDDIWYCVLSASSYAFETGCLTKPGAELVTREPAVLPVSAFSQPWCGTTPWAYHFLLPVWIPHACSAGIPSWATFLGLVLEPRTLKQGRSFTDEFLQPSLGWI